MDIAQPIFLLLWLLNGCHGELNTAAFQTQIQSLANDILGADKFQKYVDDNVVYSSPVSDPADILQQLSDSLSYKITKRMEAVTAMRDNIQANFGGYQSKADYENCCACCAGNDIFGRLKFHIDVNTNTMCHTGRGITNGNQQKYPAEQFYNTMNQNFVDNTNLKWQYFGGEDGIMTIFPSNKACDTKYDPRYRPWYSQTAFPTPKDVVLIIDKSGSMGSPDRSGRTLMDLAQEAGKTVVDTLNPDDRVAVVTFSSAAYTNNVGCFGSKLAVANPENKNVFNSYINGVKPGGGTEYGLAFQKAFTFFENTRDNPDFDTRVRVRIILFLTDGQPNDSGYLKIIKDENQKLGNTVTILSFGFGDGIDNSVNTRRLLEDIARQRLVTEPAIPGANIEGRFVYVSDPSNLRYSMATYYDFFSNKNPNQEVTISVPYLDAFGLGLITSVCLPVHTENIFRGVTCIDITLSDLFSDATYFSQNSNNYAFINDGQTRLLVHPLVPRPADVNDHPVVLRILDLEVATQMTDIVQNQIIKGIAGSSTFNSRRVLSRGDSEHDGVDTISKSSLYLWKPLGIANLTLVVVMADGAVPTSPANSPAVTSFPYHRLDISRPSGTSLCRYLNRIAISDFSVVKLAAASFNSPDLYLERQETMDVINSYKEYFLNNGDTEFRTGVKEAVGISAKIDDVINKSNTAWHEAVWRYVGMREGVMRVFPGVKFVKEYDPTVRSWYTRAMAQKDAITLSKPYVDAFGAGLVITLAKAIYEPETSYNHGRDDDTIGAMGMDFTLDLFNSLITKHIPECGQYQCFVIDRAGYIISHPDFVGVQEHQAYQVENIHITAKEPSIASSLFNDGKLVKDGCINFEKKYVQTFWRLGVNKKVYTEFEIHAVTGTNIYVIVKKIDYHLSTCSCQSSSSTTIPTCSNTECQCPCYNRDDVQYNQCTTTFNFGNEIGALPPCTPKAAFVDLSSVAVEEANRVKDVPFCYPVKELCPKLTSDLNCSSTAGCLWCNDICQARGLACQLAVEDTTISDGGGGGGGSNTTIIVAVVVVLLILIVVGAVVAFVIIKKRRNARPGSGTRAGHGGHDNPGMDGDVPNQQMPTAPHFGHAEYEMPSRFEPPPKYNDVIS